MFVLELAGEEDRFAAAESTAAATGVDVVGPGLALAETITPARIRGLGFTRRATEVIAQSRGTIPAATAELQAAELERTGTVAVRARDIRGTADVSTQTAERALGQVLQTEGFRIDLEEPENELRALFADDQCVLGWLVVEVARDFAARAPTDKPFFQPGAMAPVEARAIANFCRAQPDRTVLDPMCGTGGMLVEAGLLGARVIGIDAQAKMVAGARANFKEYLETPFAVIHGDAATLPACGPVDAVVVDVPYGRQSKIAHQERESLLRETLAEASRITDRAVVISDHSLAGVAGAVGWRVDTIFERRVHGSLTRHIHLLTEQSFS